MRGISYERQLIINAPNKAEGTAPKPPLPEPMASDRCDFIIPMKGQTMWLQQVLEKQNTQWLMSNWFEKSEPYFPSPQTCVNLAYLLQERTPLAHRKTKSI